MDLWTYYYRDQWMALPPKEKLERLKHPVHKLVLSYKTHFPVCYSQSHCEETMKLMQKYYMEKKKMADMPYNFVIGGDDEVYEARGFKYRADKRLSFSRFYKDKLHIAYIGDWTTEEPPRLMKDLCFKIVEFAIKKNVLAEDYELLLVRGKYRGNVWDQYNEEVEFYHKMDSEAIAASNTLIYPPDE